MTFLLLVALFAADGILTYRIIKAGGRELNPVVRWMMDRAGIVPALVIPKALLLWGLWYVPQAHLPVGGLYLAVAAWNVYQRKKQ